MEDQLRWSENMMRNEKTTVLHLSFDLLKPTMIELGSSNLKLQLKHYILREAC